MPDPFCFDLLLAGLCLFFFTGDISGCYEGWIKSIAEKKIPSSGVREGAVHDITAGTWKDFWSSASEP